MKGRPQEQGNPQEEGHVAEGITAQQRYYKWLDESQVKRGGEGAGGWKECTCGRLRGDASRRLPLKGSKGKGDLTAISPGLGAVGWG